MRKESRKTRARELAIFAMPLTVSGLAWYVAPGQPAGLYWAGTGVFILGYAAWLWWKPEA